MKRRRVVLLLTMIVFAVIFLLVALSLPPVEKPAPPAPFDIYTVNLKVGPPYNVPAGIFITSIYGFDFPNERYSVIFWLWTTYDTEKLKSVAGADYVPFQKIEVVNALNKIISPTEQYLIPNPDGSTYAIAKFTAVINQHWDVRNFPLDKQNLTLVLESVGSTSSDLHFVPDLENSLISEELLLSGWKIGQLKLEALNYEYQSTFGDPSQKYGVYPRLLVQIPIQRLGGRLFINAFLGFFISFIITSMLYLLDTDMLSSRLGLIMTALFAAVGNKYTIDSYFPNQTAFSLSDLVQIASFLIIAIGLVTTMLGLRLVKLEKHELAVTIDRWTLGLTVPLYIFSIAFGVWLALRA
jgi:hypothetical protein